MIGSLILSFLFGVFVGLIFLFLVCIVTWISISFIMSMYRLIFGEPCKKEVPEKSVPDDYIMD